MTMEARSF